MNAIQAILRQRCDEVDIQTKNALNDGKKLPIISQLTIEELRFAMQGDDDANMSRIIFQLFYGELAGFGEERHYFQANYSERFHRRLVDFGATNQLHHPLQPGTFTFPYLAFATNKNSEIPHTYGQPQSSAGVYFSSSNNLVYKAPYSKVYKAYDVDGCDQRWAAYALEETMNALEAAGWLVEFHRQDVIGQIMTGAESVHSKAVKDKNYTLASTTMTDLFDSVGNLSIKNAKSREKRTELLIELKSRIAKRKMAIHLHSIFTSMVGATSLATPFA